MNIDQVFVANPITSNAATDLIYFGQSPYGIGDDAAMTYSNFAAQFGAPYTAAALTKTDDTNVTLTLGGTPATALLHAASLTLGWTGNLSVARGGSGAGSFTAHGILIGEDTSAFTPIVLAAGQVLIGTTASDPIPAAINSGTNILVGNASGSITISTTGIASFSWIDVIGTSQALAINTGYIADNAGLVTFTLPVTAAQGTIISISGNGAGGWIVAQNASQNIKFGNQTTTTGVSGSLASTNRYDQLDILCTVANTTWVVRSSSGNLTVV
jgi:hypothetical protein